jgi:tripartite-type tricarboxylate transporter receptor subunit TctC
MPLPRRTFLQLAAGAVALPALSAAAHAQGYPTRPVTLTVFVPPGGAPDIIARLIGQTLAPRLGQPVVIDNRPGGGGNVALQAVARAVPDGHTLLLVATPHAINVTLHEKSNASLTNDIVPVASINSDAFVMLVSPALPAQTIPDFIAHARANPGKINMTSSGTGNLSQLAGELFRMSTGIQVVHVPYRGTPAALTALMAGDGHVMFDALPSALPHVTSGRLRALGVTVGARTRLLPDVPPISDFVPGYAASGWLGIGAPRGTPPEIVERLSKEINAAVAEPAVRTRLLELGSEPLPAGTPAEFGRHIAAETEKWGKVIRSAGIKSE